LGSPLSKKKFVINCPIIHIKPPTINAQVIFFTSGLLGDFWSTYFEYSA
jgi:hypothetical protein